MSETVIREVTRNVWTFSRPFSRFGLILLGGRSTAIRMKDGGVWVLASTPLDEGTKSTLDKLGPVRYIVGANAVHHLFLDQYKKVYPSAKLVAPAAALERLEDKSLQFDGAWGRDSLDTKYGFEDDIKTCYFDGFKNKDVAFFHPESKTLIQADLLFNLPSNEQYSKSPKSWRDRLPLPHFNPSSGMHARALGFLGVDKEAMKRDAKTVASWDFERIIPCHGDVIEKRGKDAWASTYKSYLSENQ